MNKLPIGIQPQWIWRETRCQDLVDAIKRYVATANYTASLEEWTKELNDHVWWLHTNKRVIGVSDKVSSDKIIEELTKIARANSFYIDEIINDNKAWNL